MEFLTAYRDRNRPLDLLHRGLLTLAVMLPPSMLWSYVMLALFPVVGVLTVAIHLLALAAGVTVLVWSLVRRMGRAADDRWPLWPLAISTLALPAYGLIIELTQVDVWGHASGIVLSGILPWVSLLAIWVFPWALDRLRPTAVPRRAAA